ncbi:MAG: PKD domain-containing protein [Kiritimatiellae bacterium]|nr:PKD domain-containing protein [Kiritimatiellia bacterium]
MVRRFVFALLLSALPCAALPAWLVPDCRDRFVFSVPDDARSYVLLSVESAALEQRPSAFRLFDSRGGPLPCRVAHTNASVVTLLAHVWAMGREREAVLYAGPDSAADAPAEPGADPEPVAVGFYEIEAKGLPDSWPKMRHMLARAGALRQRTLHASFRKELPRRGKDRWTTKRYIVTAQTHVLCPQPGPYVFALDCHNAGFLLLDGAPVAEWPGEHEGGSWRPGVEFRLEAGVHRLELVNVHDGSVFEARVGWRLPGEKEVAPIPPDRLLGAVRLDAARHERIDRSLQPAFTVTKQAGYAFRGQAPFFLPVSFADASRNWLDSPPTRREWAFGDGGTATGASVSHVFAGRARHRVTLTVRDALGFEASCSREVDLRHDYAQEYAASFRPVLLPAVCWPADRVEPALRVQTDRPSAFSLRVEWEAAFRDGRRQSEWRETACADEPVWAPLVAAQAGALSVLDWRVRHHGLVLGSGRIRFLHSPLPAVSLRAEGDRLYDGSDQVVLVPGRRPPAPAAPAAARRAARVACLDDALGAGAGAGTEQTALFSRVVAQMAGLDAGGACRYVSLRQTGADGGAYRPLAVLARIAAALQDDIDVAVLSLGLHDILSLGEPALFERRAAAMTELAAARGVRIVWVTPPPYPEAPVPVREFAAAVKRVAVARGVPVADLYTTFMGMQKQTGYPFFDASGVALSERGHRLAGQTITRALLAPNGEGR